MNKLLFATIAMSVISCAAAWAAKHQFLGMEVWWAAAMIVTGVVSVSGLLAWCILLGSKVVDE